LRFLEQLIPIIKNNGGPGNLQRSFDEPDCVLRINSLYRELIAGLSARTENVAKQAVLGAIFGSPQDLLLL
jgi:hypothetical protein